MHGCLQFQSAEGRRGYCLETNTCIAGHQCRLAEDRQVANTFDELGYKIPVRDETGGIVILIGVATFNAPAMRAHLSPSVFAPERA
jgi:hypothetical protein